MDPEQELEAQARLEADYMAGKLTADEYTERRRALHAGTPLPSDETAEARYASWGRRAAAYLLDWMIVLVVIVAEVLVLARASSGLLALFIAPALYNWLMVGAWGQTVGKMAFGIRVLQAADMGRVTYARSAARVGSIWLLAVLWLPLLVAYLWPLWDARKQTLYDMLAGTVVVRDTPS